MSRKTILIIEDDPQLQAELTSALAEAGYAVKNAYDGAEGLRMALEERPDLVVLDLILPKMYGLKVLRSIKQRAPTKYIPVVVLSNLDQAEQIDLAVRFGAKVYLTKPNYPTTAVRKKIQAILGDA